MALTVNSIVRTTPSRMRWSNRNSPTTCHSSCLFVATEWTSEAPNSRIRAAATQRPGWRTGMALISSGRLPCSSLSVGPGTATSRRAQRVAPLIVGLLMAADWSSHFLRIDMYVPSAISCFSAASTGFAMPLFFGSARPSGAVPNAALERT